VPSIRSRDVACAEWSNARRFEHFLKLFDVVNDALNVHARTVLRKNLWLLRAVFGRLIACRRTRNHASIPNVKIRIATALTFKQFFSSGPLRICLITNLQPACVIW